MRERQVNPALERVTIAQAAAELNIDVMTVRYLMREGRLLIGNAIKRKGSSRYSYYIYRGALEEEKQRIIRGEAKW